LASRCARCRFYDRLDARCRQEAALCVPKTLIRVDLVQRDELSTLQSIELHPPSIQAVGAARLSAEGALAFGGKPELFHRRFVRANNRDRLLSSKSPVRRKPCCGYAFLSLG
jgi:hypothetical protein